VKNNYEQLLFYFSFQQQISASQITSIRNLYIFKNTSIFIYIYILIHNPQKKKVKKQSKQLLCHNFEKREKRTLQDHDSCHPVYHSCIHK